MFDAAPKVTKDLGYSESKVVVPIETAMARMGCNFISSTGVVPVPAGELLYITWSNPVGSGLYATLYLRSFSSSTSDGDQLLKYKAFANPTNIPTNALPAINKHFNHPNVSVIETRFIIDTESNIGPIGGVEGSGETIPSNGVPRDRFLDVIVPPGQTVGFSIQGAGNGNIANIVKATVTLEWYEEYV